tara:strand:- start:1986 stop:2603 length:618 start_codon:yes stop_codon:yes gene_type:complete
MLFPFRIEELLIQQTREVELWHKSFSREVLSSPIEIKNLISMQHQVNFELWHKEDLARDPVASDSKIASVKRAIDVLNQRRNDLIEQIDHFLVNFLKSENISAYQDAEMNSETPGNIIDRLSINALKIYHMHEETRREVNDKNHLNKTKEKLNILLEQRSDLGKCLQKLIEDLIKGKKILKIYRQMKMYNDESLNPVLYSKKRIS